MVDVMQNGAGTPTVAPEPLLRIEDLVVHYGVGGGPFNRSNRKIHAVEGVSLTLSAGETVGLVGESGCGKSTTARAVVRLIEPTAGRIVVGDVDVTHLGRKALRPLRRELQMVFQDPYGSLNPRLPISEIIAEPLKIHGRFQKRSGRARVDEVMSLVGLTSEYGKRYPHQLSGGQRQRVGIARALALDPKILILDEPVSALDVSIQAQVINLLEDIQARLGIAFLFIAHNLSVVRQISDRVVVMYLGKVMEMGSRSQVYSHPAHPYTRALLSAAPIADPAAKGRRQRITLKGDVPSPADPPTGCVFHTRCWLREQLDNPERCVTEVPQLVDIAGTGQSVACHFTEHTGDAIRPAVPAQTAVALAAAAAPASASAPTP
jgi:peptide/nickel transport system ATP-binding protein/oligopeptide transport system ATP-binding protein